VIVRDRVAAGQMIRFRQLVVNASVALVQLLLQFVCQDGAANAIRYDIRMRHVLQQGTA
jgi:hypothetical protein